MRCSPSAHDEAAGLPGVSETYVQYLGGFFRGSVQAVWLLKAVEDTDPAMVGFFACMYYAALRPGEVVHLRKAGWTPVRDSDRQAAPSRVGWLCRASVRLQLRQHLAKGADSSPDDSRGSLTAGSPSLRPAARLRVPLAQRWRARHPGRRVGRAQRRRPAQGLRQVHRRAGGQRSAARGPSPELVHE